VFLVNSRLGLVCATVSSSRREADHPTAVVLLPKLRTQFAEFLDQGSLDRLRILYVPTCVGLGYGHLDHSLEVFLGSGGSLASPERFGVVSQDDGLLDLPGRPPYTLAPGQPSPGSSYLPALPHRWPTTGLVGSPRRGSLSAPDPAWARSRWYWNINQSSIAYACRPRLRSRLTLGG
jgi:hypothetical protein